MVKRIFVEKKKGYDIEAQGMFRDLKQNLKIEGLTGIRIIICYDVEGIDKKQYEKARNTIFSEPQVDVAYDEIIRLSEDERVFAVQYLPGQYDQQADFAAQCLQILTTGEKPVVRVSRVIAASGDITDEDFNRIKSYCINPIESHEVSLDKPETLETDYVKSHGEKTVEGFIDKTEQELAGLIDELSLAMDVEDIKFCRRYFKEREKRNPTLTELRMIDTYWSDHCRHTTFLTKLEKVEFEDEFIKNVFESYRQDRSQIYRDNQKSISLMDIATLAMKKLKAEGMLSALDLSDEINACSIKVDAEIDGEKVPYLVMFKNETHNHPTEIEPFGGAATCLGGAIRDPLSGRSYVYQAMRVTGSGDPRRPVEQTLPGKLPQRKITTTAAAGYSSYGNQVGLATGLVNEIYDEGYVAKRMEIGAVIGAAPSYNVVRKAPKAGDVVILLGGATGRDGCGGATGSSKAHTEKSLLLCGAEVQKGNPPEERKIQRLFRNPEATRLIKRCNDFGAGGVSVAIGELADGLVIDLDRVPKKYEGLTGTELAISESQERMAVVVDKDDEDRFIALAGSENLSATPVARVTDEKRLVMKSEGKIIVDISRSFLNTNGAEKSAVARVATADCSSFFKADVSSDVKDKWLETLSDLNVCSQKGLVERFDSSIGAASVLMPFGGKYQLTPEQAMVSKIPVLNGDTDTATIMTFGYNPGISKLSPFHGAVYAIVESISKLVAAGGNYKNACLTLQEYFERLGNDPLRWGKPVAALLGAYYTQVKLGIAAIGGKDSMSGTFNDIDVPPTLVSFAVAAENAGNIISGEFKKDASPVVLIKIKTDKNNLPDFDDLAEKYEKIYNLIKDGKVLSAYAVKGGGLCEAISKMAFGNKIGFKFAEIKKEELFYPYYGSIVLELSENLNFGEYIGTTTSEGVICAGDFKATVDELINVWQQPLESVFPTAVDGALGAAEKFEFQIKNKKHSKYTFAKPRVFIPVFPGTNCEYDTQRAFEKAGAECDIFVMKNLTPADIESSIEEMSRRINKAQIVMLPGGFSAGDEPGGSGKFIATVFRNPIIKEDILNLIYKRDGLMLGICNGFQALIKLGLVPYGEIRDMDSSCPTLTYNTIGRHVSTMVRTVVSSNLSPWLYESQVGEIHTIPVSHGEGRFVASDEMIKSLSENGQIATQYVDFDGNPTYDIRYNPNGSVCAVEGITSPDGRVLGKMGHSERTGKHVAINVPGSKEQKIFVSGVNYFK